MRILVEAGLLAASSAARGPETASSTLQRGLTATQSLSLPFSGSGYRLDRAPLPGGRTITIGDLAAALLDTVVAPDLHRCGVYVSN